MDGRRPHRAGAAGAADRHHLRGAAGTRALGARAEGGGRAAARAPRGARARTSTSRAATSTTPHRRPAHATPAPPGGREATDCFARATRSCRFSPTTPTRSRICCTGRHDKRPVDWRGGRREAMATAANARPGSAPRTSRRRSRRRPRLRSLGLTSDWYWEQDAELRFTRVEVRSELPPSRRWRQRSSARSAGKPASRSRAAGMRTAPCSRRARRSATC